MRAYESTEKYGLFEAWAKIIETMAAINQGIDLQDIHDSEPIGHRWTRTLNAAADFIREICRGDIALLRSTDQTVDKTAE